MDHETSAALRALASAAFEPAPLRTIANRLHDAIVLGAPRAAIVRAVGGRMAFAALIRELRGAR